MFDELSDTNIYMYTHTHYTYVYIGDAAHVFDELSDRRDQEAGRSQD